MAVDGYFPSSSGPDGTKTEHDRLIGQHGSAESSQFESINGQARGAVGDDMSNDSDLSINVFAVGKHELGIYREPDFNGTSGFSVVLTLYSTSTDAQPGLARVRFLPEITGSSDILGDALFDISPVLIGAAFPIAELDRWNELLKGDQQVYFVYVARGPARADGNTDVIRIALTTERDYGSNDSNDHFAAARSRQTLLAHLG